MIWNWMKAVLIFLLKLVVPPPGTSDPVIDINEKCPGCGHRLGELKCVMDQKQAILVRHHCKICGAGWYEKPVLDAGSSIITPAMVINAE